MRFVDEVTIHVRAGNGGHGCISFRREKFVPRGGPNGGDGGQGGDVILVATTRKQTLLDFRFRHIFKAESGRPGEGSNRHGRDGEDLLLEVPVGTVVKDAETGEVRADLAAEGERHVAAKGGRGGRGNARFATATRQAPRFAQDGEEGAEWDLRLELKLIADVGLVGFPNAGKSTLISVISAARPKVADYPFTTLVPNLGVVRSGEEGSFVVADIPGLIEGAHEGAGLGIRFLKHIERTRVLLHVVDLGAVTEEDPLAPYRAIEHELSRFSEAFSGKRRAVALNKSDLVPDPDVLSRIVSAYRETGHPVVVLSALRREGLVPLVRLLAALLKDPDA